MDRQAEEARSLDRPPTNDNAARRRIRSQPGNNFPELDNRTCADEDTRICVGKTAAVGVRRGAR
jgi:hypothetical protein